MGQQIFDSDGTFTVPEGITEITVCMCGGGGAGGYVDINPQYCSGGGFAGDIASEDVSTSQGTDIAVVVGVGGIGTASTSDDNAGTQSSFGAIVALGGPSGYDSVTPCQGYDGQGASRDTCGGTFYDGNGTHNGGQAGAFGDGGDGFAGQGTNGGDGGTGAGGGAVTQASTNRSGSGGNGRVVVKWDDFVEDGGLLINGTLIPELAADGELHFYCKDLDDNDFDGAVQELMLDGQLVWKEI